MYNSKKKKRVKSKIHGQVNNQQGVVTFMWTYPFVRGVEVEVDQVADSLVSRLFCVMGTAIQKFCELHIKEDVQHQGSDGCLVRLCRNVESVVSHSLL